MSMRLSQLVGGQRTCPNGNEFCANAPGNDKDTHIECLSCYQGDDEDDDE